MIGVVVLSILAGMTPAQSDEVMDVETVIRDQVAAFQIDDFAGAFTFASPTIRGIFQTPETFGAMVREGYPMVWRPSDLRFAQRMERGGRVYQTIVATDASGVPHRLEYEMIPTDDGWKINGVRLLTAPQVGA
jgi:hypothetical protein